MAHKYVAYVGSYTFYGSSKGITIYDVDTEKNYFTKRKEIPVNNSSYLTVSYDHRYLYSIVDEGVSAFRILPDGDLELINTAGIRGMRGCYITADRENRFLAVSGYHDGSRSGYILNRFRSGQGIRQQAASWPSQDESGRLSA